MALDVRAQDASTPRAWTSACACPRPSIGRKAEARARLAKALARGTCFATLSAQREGATATARIDLAALESIAVAARAAAVKAGLAPPTMDGLLALRGVLEAATSRTTRRP